MKAEWTQAERTIALLNMDCMTKEVFENIVRDRENVWYCLLRGYSGYAG